MINEEQARKYCCEDISKIYGYAEAIADKQNMWHCHHCLGLAYTPKQLKAKGLYYKRPASELMFVTVSEHHILHLVTNKKSISGIAGFSKGKHRSEETKRKISESHVGKLHSEESKQKMSESHKGKHLSDETKQKIRLTNTNNPKKSKKVIRFTKDGEFICEYPSIQEALRQLGIVKGGHISDCCKGKRKTAHGFVWRFAE